MLPVHILSYLNSELVTDRENLLVKSESKNASTAYGLKSPSQKPTLSFHFLITIVHLEVLSEGNPWPGKLHEFVAVLILQPESLVEEPASCCQNSVSLHILHMNGGPKETQPSLTSDSYLLSSSLIKNLIDWPRGQYLLLNFEIMSS